MAHEYDNAFRTMENDCPKLLIPLVNEVFKTNYSLDSPIELYPNEQLITSLSVLYNNFNEKRTRSNCE